MNYPNNLAGNVTLTHSLKPAARTATATGAGVSMKGGDKTDILFDLGTWTDGVHTFEIQEAADVAGVAGAFTAVAPEDIYDPNALLDVNGHLVVDAAPEDDKPLLVSYIGGKDWILVKQTITGAPATGMVAGAIVMVHLLRAVGNTPMKSSAPW